MSVAKGNHLPPNSLAGKTCFVGIGAQKAGTNWLAHYFENHPEVCFSPIKELHYFDWRFAPEISGGWHEEFARRLEKVEAKGNPGSETLSGLLRQRLAMSDRPAAYLDYFAGLVQPAHTAFGEITPSYSAISAAGFASIKRMLPDPKLIWILRNPADRFWSQLRFTMEQREGFCAESKFLDKLDAPQFVLRSDYARTMAHLFSEFRREEVLVLFYEHLFFGADRDAELCRITDFLGIEGIPGNFKKRIAASVPASLDPELRQKAVQRFAHVYEAIAEAFSPLPECWRRDLDSLRD